MIKLISLVCTLTQTKMGVGRVAFPSMGLMKGQYVFLVTIPKFSYILSFIISGGSSSDFIKMRMLISLECTCILFKTRICAW